MSGLLGVSSGHSENGLSGLKSGVTGTSTFDVNQFGSTSLHSSQPSLSNPNASSTNAETESFDVFSNGNSNSNNISTTSGNEQFNEMPGASNTDPGASTNSTPTNTTMLDASSNGNQGGTTNPSIVDNSGNTASSPTGLNNNPNANGNSSNQLSGTTSSMSGSNGGNGISSGLGNTGATTSSGGGYSSTIGQGNSDGTESTRSYSYESSNPGDVLGSSHTESTLTSSGMVSTSTDTLAEEIDNIIAELRRIGIQDADIDRILNGQITVDELWEEIFSDPDTSRKRAILEAQTLQALSTDLPDLNLNFSSIDEMQAAIDDLTKQIDDAQMAELYREFSEEKATMLLIDYMSSFGVDIEDAKKECVIAYKYKDENGNTQFVYRGIDLLGSDINEYEEITYEEMYGDSDTYKELLAVVPKREEEYTTGILWWAETHTRTAQNLNWSQEQQDFYFRLQEEIANQEYSDTYDIDESTKALIERKESLEYLLNYTQTEIDYYLEHIDPYINAPDFQEKSQYDPTIGETTLDAINERVYGYDGYVNVSSKEEMIGLLSEAFNNEDSTLSYGYIFSNENNYYYATINSSDELFNHFLTDWSHLLTEEEKQIFNYIVNTEGADAAYQYLDEISATIDNRWYEQKQKEDIEWAQAHPVLASIASVLLTPVEGMVAACHSLNTLITGAELRRTDVYSAGNTYRGAVSAHISEKYGAVWAFAYDTAMSMADTAALIGLNCLTGGTCTVLLSATTMGSRAYVSALNDALDRGVPSDQAIAFGFASAAVETICESYSVGHLMNLETKLGTGTINLVGKLAAGKPPWFEKVLFIAASGISQGLCEGEEELCTEIVNFFSDQIICGDLSQFNLTIENYINQGYDEDSAILYAFRDKGKDCALAFAGGFCSGIFFGSFKGGKLTYNAVKANTSVLNMATIDLVMQNAQEITLAERAQSILNNLNAAKELIASYASEYRATFIEKYNAILHGETTETISTPDTLTSPVGPELNPTLQNLIAQLSQTSADSSTIKTELLNGVSNGDFTLEDLRLALIDIAENKGMSLKELGSQEGAISPEILAEATSLAQSVRSNAEKVEGKISSDIAEVTYGRGRLAGFGNRLKQVDRMSNLIVSNQQNQSTNGESISLQDAASSIENSIRYTMVLNPMTYGTDLAKTLVDLQKKGYTIQKFNNFWGSDEYQGINVKLKSSDNSILELQFHTPQSYQVKENQNHLYYEISRNTNTSAMETALANAIQTLYQKEVIMPDGITEYDYEAEMKRVESSSGIDLRKAETITYTIEDAISFLVERAGISESQASRLAPLFLEGMEAASGKYTEFFKAFREHAAMHTALVTEYAARIGESIGLAGEDLRIARLSAACHDLGMRGGYYLSDKVNGQYIFKQIDEGYDLSHLTPEQSNDLANLARKNHPLNSALAVLTTDIVPESDRSLVALLAMSHSKSTSGIQHFASVDEWNASVEKLAAALNQYNEDHKTNFQFDKDGLHNIIKNEESLKILQDQALAIRDGDAMSEYARTHDGYMILQPGGYCTFEYYDAENDNYNGDYADTAAQELALLGFKDILHQNDHKATPLNLSNASQRFSAQIHLGESNAQFSSSYTINEQGDRIYRAVTRPVHEGLAPICTAAAMEERLGEVATYDNCAERQFVIALSSQARNSDGTATNLLAKYEQLVTQMKINGINGAIRKTFETIDGQQSIVATDIDKSKMCFYTGAVDARIEFMDAGSESFLVDGEINSKNKDFRIVLTYADGTVGYLTGKVTAESLSKAISKDDASKGVYVFELVDSNTKANIGERLGAYSGNIIIQVDSVTSGVEESPTSVGMVNDIDNTQELNTQELQPPTDEYGAFNHPIEPSFSISTSLDATSFMIPLKKVQEIVNTQEGFEKFMNFDQNSEYFGDISPAKKQAYILAVQQYMKALTITQQPISEDSIDRANQIIAQSRELKTIKYLSPTDYYVLTRNGPVYYPYQMLERVIFNENDYNQFTSNIRQLSNVDQYEILTPYHEIYKLLASSDFFLSIDTQQRIERLNELYIHTVNKARNILGNYSEYGANQNSVKALAQNPSINLPLYRQLEAIVKSHFPIMSKLSIKKLLLGINVKGVCSYATIVNELIVNYAGREADFRRDFGFDLYRIENGQKVINSEYIITDLFCYTNRNNNEVLSKGLFDYKVKTDEHQIAMSYYSHKNTPAIQEWLNYRRVNKIWKANPIYFNADGQTQPLAIKHIMNQISLALAQGHSVELDIFTINKGQFEFGFYPTQNNKHVTSPVYSNTWHEGGGHSILVTGVNESGDLIVSSWGKEYTLRWPEISKVKISFFESYLQ